jgi:predicted dehydrogenase
MNNVRLGFIGAGWIVEHAHIPAFLNNPHTKIVSIFDPDTSKVQKLSELFNIPGFYNNIDDFFESDIDGVIIASPNFTHAEYSLRAVSRGLHVLCEKPITFSLKEIEAIISEAIRNKVVYFPGFVNRFRHELGIIKNLISDNRIGNIRQIDAGWLRRSGIPRPNTWFTNKSMSGGGVLIDLGSHIIDLCLLLNTSKELDSCLLTTSQLSNTVSDTGAKWFNSQYTREFEIDVEDTAFCSMHYRDESRINVKLSWRAPIKADCTYFSIKGTNGEINLKTLFGFSNDRLWPEDSLTIHSPGGKIEHVQVKTPYSKTVNAFETMADNFIESIRTDTFLKVHDGALETVSTIERLYSVQNEDADSINSYSFVDFN